MTAQSSSSTATGGSHCTAGAATDDDQPQLLLSHDPRCYLTGTMCRLHACHWCRTMRTVLAAALASAVLVRKVAHPTEPQTMAFTNQHTM
jgi:hypothetical protein